MDTSYPHDVRQFDEIPPNKKGRYIPVPERVATMTPDERARFLSSLRARMVNVSRTSAIAQKINDSLHRVLDPAIDKMDEDGKDADNAPLILGVLVGCRLFLGSFTALEDALLTKIIGECGISRDGYQRMCLAADARGIQAVELVKKLVDDEDNAPPPEAPDVTA